MIGLHQRFAVAILATFFITASAQGALLTAIADNHVLKSAATTVQANGGSDPEFILKVASTTQGNARLGYLKFDLSSIAESALNEGTFTITSTLANTTPYTLQVYALKAGDANYNWSESSITYDSRPANNNSSDPLIDLAKVTQVGTSISVSNNTAAGTDFTFSFADLENYRQTDDTLTLIALVSAQSTTGPQFTFASSENTNAAIRPRLTVTAIPEPSAFGLLGLGIAGVFVRRRRRASSVR